jgi:MarR family transcriptional repressor of emrRAB
MNKKIPSGTPDSLEAVARAHKRVASATLGDAHINILIRLNYGMVMDLLNHHLAQFNLSNVGYFAMMMLYSTSDNLANPSELCRMTGETRGNMTRICDELVGKGLMRRITNPEDRRRVDLSLSEEGIALLGKAVPVLRKAVASVYRHFSDEEKSTLASLLGKLHRSLEDSL